MFGRATIRLGIGPHSIVKYSLVLWQNPGWMVIIYRQCVYNDRGLTLMTGDYERVERHSHLTSVCLWVSHRERLNALYRLQSSTDLHQTCHHGSVPAGVITYCFWWKSGILMSVIPEVELISATAAMENTFNVKYLENGVRYACVSVTDKRFGSMAWFCESTNQKKIFVIASV